MGPSEGLYGLHSSDTSLSSPLDRSPDSGGNDGKGFVGVATLGFTDHDMRLFAWENIEGLLPLAGSFPWDLKLGEDCWGFMMNGTYCKTHSLLYRLGPIKAAGD